MVDFPDTVVDLPDTMVDLPDTMVGLPDTMIDLPDTMVDHPDTMVDLPDTMVDLSDTMSHISSCFFPFHLVFPIHSSLFFKFNSRSLALIALALSFKRWQITFCLCIQCQEAMMGVQLVYLPG